MGLKDSVCARWGCGHTKREHDDPAYEGMCAHAKCSCLGFSVKRRDTSAPRPIAVPPARVVTLPPAVRPPSVPGPKPSTIAAPRAPRVPPKPVPSRPVASVATCPSVCDHCGKLCSGRKDHSGDQHFRRGRGGHTWKETPVQTLPAEAVEAELPALDLEAEREHVAAVVAEVAESLSLKAGQPVPEAEPEAEPAPEPEKLELDEPEQTIGVDTPRTVEIVQSSTAVDEPVDEPLHPVAEQQYLLAYQKHPSGQKRCPKCTQMKPFRSFSPNKSYDGLHGWCKKCTADRHEPATLSRTIRNRARHRASAELIARHRDEFRELYIQMGEEARKEADLLQDDELARELYGEEHVRLKPGRRNEGETAIDRIDVARCADCIRYHDGGHACAVCGSTPHHLEVTRTAWADTQAKLRERIRQDAGGE